MRQAAIVFPRVSTRHHDPAITDSVSVYRDLRTGSRNRSMSRLLAQWRGDRCVARRPGRRAARDPPSHRSSPRRRLRHAEIRRTTRRRLKWRPPKHGRRGPSAISRSGDLYQSGEHHRRPAGPPTPERTVTETARSGYTGRPTRFRRWSSCGSLSCAPPAWRSACRPV